MVADAIILTMGEAIICMPSQDSRQSIYGALLDEDHCPASDMVFSASVPLHIVMGIFVLLRFQSS